MKKANFSNAETLIPILGSNDFFVLWEYNYIENKYTYISDTISLMTGFTSNDILSGTAEWIKKESLNFCFSKFVSIRDSSGHFFSTSREFSLQIKKSSGENEWYKSILFPILSDNQIEGFAGVTFLNNNNLISDDFNRLRDIIHYFNLSSPDAVAIFDYSGDIISANDRAARLVETDRKNLIGMNFINFIPAENKSRANVFLTELFSNNLGTLEDFELETITGKHIHVDISASIVKSSNDRPVAFIMAFKDITQKKLTEKKIRETEMNSIALLNATTDEAYLLDSEGMIISLNKKAVIELNFANKFYSMHVEIKSEDDFIGKKISDFFPDELVRKFIKIKDQIISKKDKYRIFKEEHSFADRWYLLSAYPEYDEDGRFNRCAIFSKDITDEKAAAKKLQESEKKYAGLVESMFDGFLILDSDFRIIYANKKIYKITEFTEKKIIGKHFNIFFKDKNNPIFTDYLKKVKNGESFRFEWKITVKKKINLDVMISITPILDSDGNLEGVQALIADITTLKNIEKQLEYRASFERLISEISIGFINISINDIDNGINKALALIGKFIDVDRVYIFHFPNRNIMINTHEWCKEGVKSKKKYRSEVDLNLFPISTRKIFNKEIISVFDTFSINNELYEEYIAARITNIKSFLLMPLIAGDEVIGLIGYDSLKKKVWNDDAVLILRHFSEILVNVLNRKRARRELIDSILKRLSDREAELLKYLMHGNKWPGDKRLIGKKMDVLPGTLDKFMLRIKEKIRSDEYNLIMDSMKSDNVLKKCI